MDLDQKCYKILKSYMKENKRLSDANDKWFLKFINLKFIFYVFLTCLVALMLILGISFFYQSKDNQHLLLKQ